jgi:RNA polymerase sigma-70 factor, ECF subfamily
MEAQRERELIEMARNGDENAFRQLVEANMRKVYGLALRYLRRHEDADEAAQETFIRAYRSLDSFKGNARFSTWVYRIAVNYCLSHRRKAGRRAEHMAGVEVDERMPDVETPSQERMAMSVQTRDMVRGSLEQLSPQQRAVFVMKYLQHKTIADIADILECAEGTVKKQLFRAVNKVRDHLGPMLGREVATQ